MKANAVKRYKTDINLYICVVFINYFLLFTLGPERHFPPLSLSRFCFCHRFFVAGGGIIFMFEVIYGEQNDHGSKN